MTRVLPGRAGPPELSGEVGPRPCGAGLFQLLVSVLGAACSECHVQFISATASPISCQASPRDPASAPGAASPLTHDERPSVRFTGRQANMAPTGTKRVLVLLVTLLGTARAAAGDACAGEGEDEDVARLVIDRGLARARGGELVCFCVLHSSTSFLDPRVRE